MFALVTEKIIHFGAFLALERARRGWSGRELARLAGISQKTITNIERKESPETIGEDTLAGIAKAFGKPEEWILNEWRETPVVNMREEKRKAAPSGVMRIGEIPVLRVPLTSVKASGLADSLPPRAGDADDDGNRYVEIPTHSRRVFAAIVDGECMSPIYPNGWIVTFSYDVCEQEGILPGYDYFIQCNEGGDNESTFKRIVRQDGDDLIVQCINTDKYPDEIRIRWDRIARMARAVYVSRERRIST